MPVKSVLPARVFRDATHNMQKVVGKNSRDSGREFSRTVRDFLRLARCSRLTKIAALNRRGQRSRNGWGRNMRVRGLLLASVSAGALIEGGWAYAQDKNSGSYTTELPPVEVS